VRLLNKKHNHAGGANLLRGDARRASLQTATRLNHDFHTIFKIIGMIFVAANNPANPVNLNKITVQTHHQSEYQNI
jgi:hypothetical protein